MRIVGSIPYRKLGTPFHNPSWRYCAIKEPARFGFEDYLYTPQEGSGAYGRLYTSSPACADFSIHQAPGLRELDKGLSSELREELYRTLKTKFGRKATGVVIGKPKKAGTRVWHSRKIDKISDAFFRKIVKHSIGVTACPALDFALQFVANKDNSFLRKYIGCSFFARISDKEIALTWNLPLDCVEALRLCFFDFSAFPTAPVARYGLLRQCRALDFVGAEDLQEYQAIYEMGELGLKLLAGACALSDAELKVVRKSIDRTLIDNLLTIKANAKSFEQKLKFQKVALDYVHAGVYAEDTELKKKQTEFVIARTEQLQKSTKELAGEINDEDLKLLELNRKATLERLGPNSLKNITPYRTLAELQAEQA